VLTDYQTLVTEFARDDAGRIQTAERDRAIQLAVQRYSKDIERVKVEDKVVTNGNTLALPSAWEADASELRSLEYPIGMVPPAYLSNERYGLYQNPTAIVIMLLDAVAAGASIRVTYTITHVVSTVADSIPVKDREPVSCWAAALLCDQLAAFYSGGSDSTIQADSSPGQTRAQEYSARAKTLRKRYLDELGIDDKRNVAAGAVVNLNATDSQGRDRLTHPARFR
jgi:hypothetical protein